MPMFELPITTFHGVWEDSNSDGLYKIIPLPVFLKLRYFLLIMKNERANIQMKLKPKVGNIYVMDTFAIKI